MKSIKSTLIIYFSALVLISSVIIGFVAIQNASKAIVYEVETALVTVSNESARVTEGRIQEQKQSLSIIAGM